MAFGGEQFWCCPFCQAQVIKVFFRPAHCEFRTIRGSGQSASKKEYKQQEAKILSLSCSNCGKTKKEIEEKLFF
ncbi:MAG: hypothetical protein QW343_01305 [Candidatus Norongarragalinales archaeon]